MEDRNGRMVIHNGRNEIFFLRPLHYNDTCKVNQLFTGCECKVVKLIWLLTFQYKGAVRFICQPRLFERS